MLDEVQNLSLPLLEEIRILSDLESGGRKLLQVVLVGQPEFDEHLKLPRMRQIKQRVSVHCELGPLERDEVAGYVTHRLQVAGAAPGQVRLTDDALDLVRAASGGVPRVINLICDRALAQGHLARTSRIGPDLVVAGLAGLRMPIPVLEPSAVGPLATPTAAVATAPSRVAQIAAPVAPVPVAELAPVVVVRALPPQAVTQVQEPAVESKGLFEAKTGRAYSATGQDLDSLLDLPAVDLNVTLEERTPRRPARTPRGAIHLRDPRQGLGRYPSPSALGRGGAGGHRDDNRHQPGRLLDLAPPAVDGTSRPADGVQAHDGSDDAWPANIRAVLFGRSGYARGSPSGAASDLRAGAASVPAGIR